MDYILIFLSGVFIANYISGFLWRRTLVKLFAERVDVTVLPELTTELVDSSIRLYNNGIYICQGHTIEDVAHNFFTNGNIKLAQVRHNDKDIWFVDGKVQANLDQ